jgi:hypothetical protein
MSWCGWDIMARARGMDSLCKVNPKKIMAIGYAIILIRSNQLCVKTHLYSSGTIVRCSCVATAHNHGNRLSDVIIATFFVLPMKTKSMAGYQV